MKFCFLILVCAGQVHAEESINQKSLFACMAEALNTTPADMSTGDLREQCRKRINNSIGESLIYFDQHVQRFGVGVKLTDWL